MNIYLILAFLFFMGSCAGWVLELIFRRFFSANNPERKWINPGFCTGPYVPLYGSGLCIVFMMAYIADLGIIPNPTANRIVFFVVAAVGMTLIEYIAGIMLLEGAHVRLWDYSNEWGNYKGLVCPKFSLYWALMSAGYYFLIHPYILDSLVWLSHNLAFSFFIGLFFGFFIIDFAHASNLVLKFKKFAEENELVLQLEEIKAGIQKKRAEAGLKIHFFRAFNTQRPLHELLNEMIDEYQIRVEKRDFKVKR